MRFPWRRKGFRNCGEKLSHGSHGGRGWIPPIANRRPLRYNRSVYFATPLQAGDAMKARSLSAFFVLLLSAVSSAHADPVTFHQAVELALRHSGTMAIATADQQRAHASYLELRNMYLPQVTLGSGL